MIDFGKDTPVTALGETWIFSRCTLDHIFAFRDWIKPHLPDPMALGEKYLAMLPAEELLARAKQKEQQDRDLLMFGLETPLGQEYLKTMQGSAAMAQILLKEHHGDVSAGTALAVWLAGIEQVPDLMKHLQGQLGEPRGNSAAPAVKV